MYCSYQNHLDGLEEESLTALQWENVLKVFAHCKYFDSKFCKQNVIKVFAHCKYFDSKFCKLFKKTPVIEHCASCTSIKDEQKNYFT